MTAERCNGDEPPIRALPGEHQPATAYADPSEPEHKAIRPIRRLPSPAAGESSTPRPHQPRGTHHRSSIPRGRSIDAFTSQAAQHSPAPRRRRRGGPSSTNLYTVGVLAPCQVRAHGSSAQHSHAHPMSHPHHRDHEFTRASAERSHRGGFRQHHTRHPALHVEPGLDNAICVEHTTQMALFRCAVRYPCDHTPSIINRIPGMYRDRIISIPTGNPAPLGGSSGHFVVLPDLLTPSELSRSTSACRRSHSSCTISSRISSHRLISPRFASRSRSSIRS
ncbi:hypothetical protein ABIE52_006919 [Rhodococcus sp. OAS809]